MTDHDIFVRHGAFIEPVSIQGGQSFVLSGPAYNFGVTKIGQAEAVNRIRSVPTLYQRFPKIQGKWDGKTTINHHQAARKVLGSDLPAHDQPRGTCGGRAGSRGLELLQCVLIAQGKRAKFKYVSHALIYWLARKKYHMDNGSPSNERNDGVAGGSVPEVLLEFGCVNRDESGDSKFAGTGSDDLAVQWGCGRIDQAKAKEMLTLASDNLITSKVRASSAAECADGLAAGGVIIQSDSQGYSMVRDQMGVCKPQGTWYHYHVRSGVRVLPDGRKIFQYDQSWGDTTPSGPLLEGCPGNVFGIDWDVQDRLCRSGEVDIVFGFDLWDLENGSYDLTYLV